jgi:peptide/nickel transport system substrate-binding protein
LDAVRISLITDRKTAFLEFQKGKFDYFFGLESSYVQELLTPEGSLRPELTSRFQFIKNPYLNTEYLGIRMNGQDSMGKVLSPLQQRKIRQALNYGIDRGQMLRTLRNQVGKPATAGFVPKGLPSFSDVKVKGYNYQPEKAAALLAEAGYPGGKNMPPITLTSNNEYLDICTYITRQWEDLGVKVGIELLETALVRERMRNGQAPFFRASWIADYPDAESFLTCFYSKNPTPPNYTHFSNERFDELYEACLRETDEETRYSLYHQMDRILIDEAPVIFLFYDETALFARKNIQGLSANAINLLSLKRVRISN